LGFEVAPDDDGMARAVVGPFSRDIYRLCTISKCYYASYCGQNKKEGSAGMVSNTAAMWETDGNGEYRIMHTSPGSWYRLLIRRKA